MLDPVVRRPRRWLLQSTAITTALIAAAVLASSAQAHNGPPIVVASCSAQTLVHPLTQPSCQTPEFACDRSICIYRAQVRASALTGILGSQAEARLEVGPTAPVHLAEWTATAACTGPSTGCTATTGDLYTYLNQMRGSYASCTWQGSAINVFADVQCDLIEVLHYWS